MDNTEINEMNTEIDDKYLGQLEDKKKGFFELSLKEIMNNWTNVNVEIMKEIIEILSLDNYKLYFNNVEDGNKIYLGIYQLLKDIVLVFTKDDRGYYVGITIILISMLIYYMFITTNYKNNNSMNNFNNNNNNINNK